MPPRVKEINALISSFSATYRPPPSFTFLLFVIPPDISPQSSLFRFTFFTGSRVRSTRGNSLSRDLLGLQPISTLFHPSSSFIFFFSYLFFSFFSYRECNWLCSFILLQIYKFFSSNSKSNSKSILPRVEFEI